MAQFKGNGTGEVLFGTVIVGIPLALRLGPVWFLWTWAEWISRQMVPYAENRSRWPRLRATNPSDANIAALGRPHVAHHARNQVEFRISLPLSRAGPRA
jgi:hypothetical protein